MEQRNSPLPGYANRDETLGHGSEVGLRLAAIVADAQTDGCVALAGVWGTLSSGAERVVDHFSTEQRCYLVMGRGCTSPGEHLTPAKRDLLERVLLGQQQKAIALDLGVSSSSVASLLSDALKTLGLGCRASRVPLVLSLLVHARYQCSRQQLGRISRVVHEGRTYQVISTPRPDLLVTTRLSPAEGRVLRLLVDGKSHAEIALRRKVSARTVANQLASASRKLGISGRPELLTFIVRSDVEARPRC